MPKRLFLAACLSAVSLVASAKDAPSAAPKDKVQVAPAKLEEAKKLVSAAIFKYAREDEVVKLLSDLEYQARAELEGVLRRQDKDFEAICGAYEDARERSKGSPQDRKLKEAYYAQMNTMVVALEAKAEKMPEVEVLLVRWRRITDVKNNRAAEIMDKSAPGEAKAFREALKTIRGARK